MAAGAIVVVVKSLLLIQFLLVSRLRVLDSGGLGFTAKLRAFFVTFPILC